jgi:adenine-specific DNA-methyltransferase
MAQTAQAQVQDMIERATRLGDDVLASEIRAFAASRQFGLVFEHNRPERMRLYGKTISVGDVVQILPERGKAEDAASKLLWRVDAIASTTAELSAYKTQSYADNTEEPRSAQLEDLVAVAEYDQPIYAGLRETGRVERGGDKPYQVVINGENYHALESLLFCYAGKVDCIYIDPPYNTGAKDWKYNNDYVDGNDEYRHSKWLAMMERRLKLAKQLLNPSSSVLICTIDEKEYLRLGLLLEQVFPGERIQMISSVINPSGSSRSSSFARCCEYIYFILIGTASVQKQTEDMLHPEQRGREVRWDGFVRTGSDRLRSDRPNMFYPFIFSEENGRLVSIEDALPPDKDYRTFSVPNGCFAVFPIVGTEERRWRMKASSAREAASRGYLSFGPWSVGQKTRTIYYLPQGTRKAVERGDIEPTGRGEDGELLFGKIEKELLPFDIWNKPSHSATDYGSTLLGDMLNRPFPFPKSLYAVEDSIRFAIADKKEALVLDFFSGSGTTAHAVMRLNHQDSGTRRCICITNNEVSNDEEKKLTNSSFRHGDPEWERLGICEYITKPRIMAAITGRTPDGEPIKGDYKFIDEFPMANGFGENAVFFDLTYQNPDAVELGAAFEEVAPLLWLRAGARGSMIEHEEKSFAIADAYAVLFDYSYVQDFVRAVRSTPKLSCVYIVTDDSSRFASVKAELGDMECVRLYESYLRSFRIAAEDAVR